MKPQIKAYLFYLALLVIFLVPVMIFATNPFGEAVARSTFLSMIIAVAPLYRGGGSWRSTIRLGLVFVPVGIGVLALQSLLVHEVLHYDLGTRTPIGWELASSLYYVVVWNIAEAIVRKKVLREFGVLGPDPKSRESTRPEGVDHE